MLKSQEECFFDKLNFLNNWSNILMNIAILKEHLIFVTSSTKSNYSSLFTLKITYLQSVATAQI